MMWKILAQRDLIDTKLLQKTHSASNDGLFVRSILIKVSTSGHEAKGICQSLKGHTKTKLAILIKATTQVTH